LGSHFDREIGYPSFNVYFLSALVNYEALSSDHQAALLKVLVHLLDRQREAGVSEVEVVVNGKLPVFCGSFVHNLIQTRVDDVNFARASQVLHVRGVLGDLVAHLLENLEVLLLGVFLSHAAGGNVIQVLEPLEVGAGHTTAVGKHVGHGDDITGKECLLSVEGSRAVSTLNNNLALEVITVILVDSLLLGSRDEDVALELHELSGVKVSFSLSTVVAFERATLVPPGLD